MQAHIRVDPMIEEPVSVQIPYFSKANNHQAPAQSLHRTHRRRTDEFDRICFDPVIVGTLTPLWIQKAFCFSRSMVLWLKDLNFVEVTQVFL